MSAGDWIAAASAVAAFAALVLAVWEGSANRRHHRLSVSPLLRLDFSVHPERKSASITLANAGLGPAVFTEVRLLLDGQPAAELGISDIGQLARHAGIQGKLRYAVILPDEVLPAGNTVDLLSVTPEAFAAFPNQDLDACFRRIGFRVRYRSFYREPYLCAQTGDVFLGPPPAKPPAGAKHGPVPGLVGLPEPAPQPAGAAGSSSQLLSQQPRKLTRAGLVRPAARHGLPPTQGGPDPS